MPTTDPRIDAYIEKSAEFAQPILKHLRKLVHKACPDVEETMKWSMPHFDFKGPLCNMAAFKKHCAFGFWKQTLLEHDAMPKDRNTLSAFGKITSLKDLPSDKELVSLIHKAMELNEQGIKAPKKPATAKKELVVPEALEKALAKNKKAREHFANFSYSKKKEYAEWIADAKTDATREKRLATAVEWISDGKGRNWKYESK
ncbi:MAG TPA: YdeI/OmpD-associated family protein [Pyrinomonadaceae bacterium]|nr:YdeI/OmpD-associated family protein [Pyrinomonadaceae bacterium]HMP65492.1 YdeI/OmpD-associated family protein [Pyrinomonadaceae bacterium]